MGRSRAVSPLWRFARRSVLCWAHSFLPHMNLVAAYDSDSDSDSDGKQKTKKERVKSAGKERALPEGGDFFSTALADSDSSEDSDSDDGEDANARRGPRQDPVIAPNPSLLPSVTELFSEVTGPPEFLSPEATRPIAVNERHVQQVTKPRDMAHPAFDGSAREGNASVIGASAKMYSSEEAEERAAAAARRSESEAAEASGAGAATRQKRDPLISKPVSVEEVMANPDMLLPRKRGQDRKDREKDKRQKGQSAIGSWKTEAEMVLRQQYDS